MNGRRILALGVREGTVMGTIHYYKSEHSGKYISIKLTSEPGVIPPIKSIYSSSHKEHPRKFIISIQNFQLPQR